MRVALSAIAAWRDDLVDKLATRGLLGPALATLAPIGYMHATENSASGLASWATRARP